MEHFKELQVVMLPTTVILELNIGVKNMIGKAILVNEETLAIVQEDLTMILQQLYVLSDDKPKPNEWNMNIHKNSVFSKGEGIINPANWKKITATTDTSLITDVRMLCRSCKGSGGGFSPKCAACKGNGTRVEHDLSPKLSQQFIEKYIESYNKDEVITDVLVEYEYKWVVDGHPTIPDTDKAFLVPKLNPEDNTISINQIEDTLSKKAIAGILEKYRQFAWSHGSSKQVLNNWVRENL
jgi:hypothetical protein